MTKSCNPYKIHTIAIDDSNYQTLRSLGSVGDSFNDVITDLLLKASKRKKVEDLQGDNH
jgi:predicted CopG family antitoxin